MKIRNYKKLVVLNLLFLIIFQFMNVSGKESKIVLLDPGHGGKDGGAMISDGTLEKTINLEICIKLKLELEKLGIGVVMTRDNDEGLGISSYGKWTKRGDLNYRCNLKKTSKCNLFISIHQNTFPQGYCKGAQIWYSDNPKSKELSELLQKDIKEKLEPNNKRVSKAAKDDFKVLRCDEIPSLLIEGGFLSNLEDRKKLKDSKYQEEFAKLIARNINIYFSTIGKE